VLALALALVGLLIALFCPIVALAVGELAVSDVPLEPVDRPLDGAARLAFVAAELWDRPELFVLSAFREARSVTSTRPSSETGRSVTTPPSGP
jgi:hypothetical protein